MDRLFRIDFYPQDWLIATGSLTAEECGIYIQIISLIYARRGPIENDPDDISRKLKSCSPRLAKAIIFRLIEKGKIKIIDGKLSQTRAEHELNSKRTHLEHSAKGGRTKAEKGHEINKNKDLTSSGHVKSLSTPTATPSLKEKERKKDSPPPPSISPVETQMAISIYNELARTIGLPLCQRISPDREKRLRARLSEIGGLDGWKAAMEKLSKSSFLTGGGERGWKADIDFILQQRSFTKLMEGSYDERTPAEKNRKPDYFDGISEAARRAAKNMGA